MNGSSRQGMFEAVAKRRWGGLALTLMATGCLLVLLTGCQPPRSASGGFDSDDPASRLYAIRRAGEQRDQSSLPQLVVELDSDDPAVRMLAIEALERITGERLGYNPYASRQERDPMVQRWAQAVSSGQFATAQQQTGSE